MESRLITAHLAELKARLRRVKVVYSDLDNTLLGPGSSLFMTADTRYSVEPAQSLVRLLKAAIDVVLISGRNDAQLREIVRILGLKNYVAELGCLIIYDQGREVVRNYNFPGAYGNLHKAIARSGAPELLLQSYKGRLEYHTPWSKRQECTHLLRGLIDVREANDLLATNGFANLRILDNGYSRSSGTLKDLPEIHVYHLLPSLTSKASAILLDQKRRQLDRAETIAVGDSITDLEMASAVGAFFLVTDGMHQNPHLDGEFLTYTNTYVTARKMGLGWAEVANLLTK